MQDLALHLMQDLALHRREARLMSSPKSPFRSDSFEPRFVIESTRREALRHAVELWLLSMGSYWRADSLARYIARQGEFLLVEKPMDELHGEASALHQWSFPQPMPAGEHTYNWEKLPEPLPPEKLC